MRLGDFMEKRICSVIDIDWYGYGGKGFVVVEMK